MSSVSLSRLLNLFISKETSQKRLLKRDFSKETSQKRKERKGKREKNTTHTLLY